MKIKRNYRHVAISIVGFLIGWVSLGTDLALSQLSRIDVVEATLDHLTSNFGWYYLKSLIYLMAVTIVSAGIAVVLRRVTFVKALTLVPETFFSLSILVLRSLHDPYLLSSPVPFLRLMAWLGVGAGLIYLFKNFAPSQRNPVSSEFLLGVVAFGVAFLWAAGFLGPRRHPVGDEPSYLMITHSLAQDYDINMNDDYHAAAYQRFYSGKYPMFTHLGYDGINYPHHSVGLPLILAPVYKVFLKSGNDELLVLAMRLCMGLIFAICAYQTLLLCKLLVPDSLLSAHFAVWTCFLSGPLIFFANEIYPEIVTALLLVISVRLILNFHGTIRFFHWIFIGVSAGFLPWLGIKYIPTAMALLCVAVFVSIKEKKSRAILISLGVPVLASAVVYLAFLYIHYRNLNPTVIYTGVIPGTGTACIRPGQPDFIELLDDRIGYLILFIWGMLLEQRIGILIYAPIYLFIISGIVMGYKADRKSTLILLVPPVTHIVLYGLQNNWGGYCPPNRQFVAVAPFFVCLVALGLRGIASRAVMYLSGAAGVFGWFIAWICLRNERWIYHTMNPHLSGGESGFLRAVSPDYALDLPRFFPLIMGDIRNHVPNIVWTLVFALIVAVVLLHKDSNSVKLSMPSWRFYVLLVVLTGTGMIYHWFFIPAGSFLVDDPNGFPSRKVILDDNHLGEGDGSFWIAGESITNLILGMPEKDTACSVDLYSLVPNYVHVNLGGTLHSVFLDGKNHANLKLLPRRAFERGGIWYVKFKLFSEKGVIPKDIMDSADTRFLGVHVRIER